MARSARMGMAANSYLRHLGAAVTEASRLAEARRLLQPLDFAALGGPVAPPASGRRNPAWRLPETGFSLDAAMDEFIAEALRETDDNLSAAARRLDVPRDFLRYRLKNGKSDSPESG